MKRHLEVDDDQFAALSPQEQEIVMRLERQSRERDPRVQAHQSESPYSYHRIKTEQQFREEVASNQTKDGRTIVPDLFHRDANIPWRPKPKDQT